MNFRQNFIYKTRLQQVISIIKVPLPPPLKKKGLSHNGMCKYVEEHYYVNTNCTVLHTADILFLCFSCFVVGEKTNTQIDYQAAKKHKSGPKIPKI